MPDTTGTEQRGRSAAVKFDGESFDQRCRELGATTEQARSELAGVERSTLRRYRKGITVPLLPDAIDFASRLGLEVTDLWKDAA